MDYPVGEIADLAGISVRTLHHYDEIGLLPPGERSAAGHRRYSDADVDRLQRILFYRELGFPLDQVAKILDDPDADHHEHLDHQRSLLLGRIERLEALVALIDRTLEAKSMGYQLTPAEKLRVYSGKVRDIYDAGDGLLLIVASDRISVFDVVLGEKVPDKGRVLTAMSTFWFDELSDVLPNHLVSTDITDLPEEWVGRSTLARRAEMLKIECIVRGYLSGSAWKEYQANGTMNGEKLPAGLQESDRLPEPVFTPSTKADIGDHDVNISFDDACDIVGKEVAGQARDASLELYRRGAERALHSGIVIADTKFELGFIDGELAVCDEVLTQDSSRFWPADQVTLGSTPPSFDKQPVRDDAESLGWDKTPPPPPMPHRHRLPPQQPDTSGGHRTEHERDVQTSAPVDLRMTELPEGDDGEQRQRRNRTAGKKPFQTVGEVHRVHRQPNDHHDPDPPAARAEIRSGTTASQ